MKEPTNTTYQRASQVAENNANDNTVTVSYSNKVASLIDDYNAPKKNPCMTIALSKELHYEVKEFVHEARDISHADIYRMGLKVLMTERGYKFKRTNPNK